MPLPNDLKTNDMIGKHVLMEFSNNLVAARTCKRQWEKDFNNRSGNTIRIFKPTRYVAQDGPTITDVQAIDQRTTDLAVLNYKTIPVALTDENQMLQLDSFLDTIMAPVGRTLGNAVDTSFYAESKAIYNFVGTAGTAPNSFAAVNAANTKLDLQGVPMSERLALMNVSDGAAVKEGLSTQFNYSAMNERILDSSKLGRLANLDFYQAQNVASQVTASGTVTSGTVTLSASAVTGATTLAMTGLTASITIYKGAVFQVAGVGSVNPLSRNPTGQIMNFVVTEDTAVSGGGTVTLPISPEIVYDGGPYVNVTSLPASGATVTFQASHNLNIIYHPEAFTLAMMQLPVNNSGCFQKIYTDKDSGISIRMTRQFQINSANEVIRFDCNYAIKCVEPQFATRLLGSTPAYAA
jgi:hypothetical protein